MKAKDLLEWHRYLDSKGIDETQALILVHIFMGSEHNILRFDGCIDTLRKKGYINDRNMLTDKALALSFICDKKRNPEIEKLAEKIREIFPIIIIKTSNKPARSPVSEVAKKLEWVKLTYPSLSDNLILEATQKYVDHYAQRNYEYMQTCSYFVSKEDANKIKTSTLVSWCETIAEESKTENKFGIDV